ncbi:MAG TPA: hypothetical protein PLS55_08920, partial [Thermogutta sp.]|nr:hypothetical protein [Thermogutta sp.]
QSLIRGATFACPREGVFVAKVAPRISDWASDCNPAGARGEIRHGLSQPTVGQRQTRDAHGFV